MKCSSSDDSAFSKGAFLSFDRFCQEETKVSSLSIRELPVASSLQLSGPVNREVFVDVLLAVGVDGLGVIAVAASHCAMVGLLGENVSLCSSNKSIP